jgi:plasmid stability protein
MEGRMAKTTIELPESLHRTLRVKAAMENQSMNAIVLAALRRYLESFRLDPAVFEVETIPTPRREEGATSESAPRMRGKG